MRTTTTLLLAALATLPGCACDAVPADAVVDCNAAQVLPDAVATDILFVVDDSGSMSQEQANLRSNLGAFIVNLTTNSPVENHFRIGVTSTSVEEFDLAATQAYGGGPSSGVPFPAGALVAVAQDAAGNGRTGLLVHDATAYPATGGWGGARILDWDSPTLVRDFRANVLLGTNGSGKEQPLRAARLALSDRLADANAGFLRPGARLAVIVVTDEDDCSDSADPRAADNAACHDVAVKDASPPILDPVDDFAAFLFGPIDGELRDVTVGVIAGFSLDASLPPALVPDLCLNRSGGVTYGQAFDKGDRFAALLANIGGARMRLGSICDRTFADTLDRFAEILMPSSVPLRRAPADWRMLVVSVTRPDGSRVSCPLAVEGTAEAGAAATGAVYAPPRFGRPAQVTFQNACKLGLGDQIGLSVVCAN